MNRIYTFWIHIKLSLIPFMVRLESCSGIIMNRTYDQRIMNAKHGAFVLCIYVYISSIPKPLNILLSAESPLFEQWQVQVYECWVNNMIALCLVLDAVQCDKWLEYYICNLLVLQVLWRYIRTWKILLVNFSFKLYT